MKRLLAIIFLAIFLFNVIGYYAVYIGLRSQANTALKEKLDSGSYNESEMLSMKIPLTLPYQSDWQSFERVDGDFEQNGEFYNLVKQKVERDTLTIYYIKDHREARLFKSLTGFVHATTDTPMSKSTGKLISSTSGMCGQNQFLRITEGNDVLETVVLKRIDWIVNDPLCLPMDSSVPNLTVQ